MQLAAHAIDCQLTSEHDWLRKEWEPRVILDMQAGLVVEPGAFAGFVLRRLKLSGQSAPRCAVSAAAVQTLEILPRPGSGTWRLGALPSLTRLLSCCGPATLLQRIGMYTDLQVSLFAECLKGHNPSRKLILTLETVRTLLSASMWLPADVCMINSCSEGCFVRSSKIALLPWTRRHVLNALGCTPRRSCASR